MNSPQVTLADILREAWFWSEILRDHTNFIHDNLAPDQEQQIQQVNGLRQTLGQLADQAKQLAQAASITAPAGALALESNPERSSLAASRSLDLQQFGPQTQQLVEHLLAALNSLLAFKQDLLQQKLDCRVKLGLTPTTLSHMIMEAEEAHRALSGARESNRLSPVLETLHNHLLWIPDAAEHAILLQATIAGVEKRLQEKAMGFMQRFNGLQIKTLELYRILRLNPRPTGTLQRLTREAMLEISDFRKFLAELRSLLERCQLLIGNVSPAMADHMLREELYYTERILLLPEMQGQA